MSTKDREFDIIVYGATGYTGRLVAEYLHQHYGGKKGAPKWAMAGRNQAKLEDVRTLIGAPEDTPLVVADADSREAMEAMAKRTSVVITTVGPYQLYGDELVAACARTGTDYADLCGEPGWMREQIDTNHELAKASGARICFSSGFDSIPFDLGVFMLQKEAVAKFGTPAPRVKGRVRAMEGTFSGGTAASLTATMKSLAKNPKLISVLQSPFGLTPGFEGPNQPNGMIPEYDEKLGKWAAPFIMAAINTKNVHRSNYLLGHPYGEDFTYDEMVMTGPGERGQAAAEHVAKQDAFGANPPKPGEGPSAEERETGFYEAAFYGGTKDTGGENMMVSVVTGDKDPGYGSTSKMIAECALTLTRDVDRDQTPGGVYTPAAAMREALIARLREHAGLTFEMEDAA